MGRLADVLGKRMRMLKEDALAVAKVVEEAFAGHSELEDDAIAPDLRQVFYDLQDAKVLDVRRKEYVEGGELLRGYQWHVIDEEPEMHLDAVHPSVDPEAAFYESLGEQAWTRRSPGARSDA